MEFLSPAYEYIYLFICTLVLLQVIKTPAFLDSNNRFTNQGYNYKSLYMLIAFLVIFIGLRPMTKDFGDTAGYYEIYQYELNDQFIFSWDEENLIFDNLRSFFASAGFNYNAFLTLVSIIYFTGIAIACRKIFKNNAAMGLCSYLVGFSTYSYSVNGYKAGAAAAIFLVALAYKEKLWLTTPLALISVGFHHSMKVVVYAYIIAYIFRNTKWYFYGWLFCLLMAVLHVGFFQNLFSGYGDEKALEYLQGAGRVNHMTGFRLDFILYSAAPVYIGYIMYVKNAIRNENYEVWLRMYLLLNGIWMLCMYASFTNRIAYLSWFMYPIVLIYPYYAMYTSDNQLVVGKKIAMYHLYFTLFMIVVYYGILSWHN